MNFKVCSSLLFLALSAPAHGEPLRPDQQEITILVDNRASGTALEPQIYSAPMWRSDTDPRTQKEAAWHQPKDDGEGVDEAPGDQIYTLKTRLSKAEFVLFRVKTQADAEIRATQRVKMPAEAQSQILIQLPKGDGPLQFKSLPLGSPLPKILSAAKSVEGSAATTDGDSATGEPTRGDASAGDGSDGQASNPTPKSFYGWSLLWALLFTVAAYLGLKGVPKQHAKRLSPLTPLDLDLLSPLEGGVHLPPTGARIAVAAAAQSELLAWLLLELGQKQGIPVILRAQSTHLTQVKGALTRRLKIFSDTAADANLITGPLSCIFLISEAQDETLHDLPNAQSYILLDCLPLAQIPAAAIHMRRILVSAESGSDADGAHWVVTLQPSQLAIREITHPGETRFVPLKPNTNQGD